MEKGASETATGQIAVNSTPCFASLLPRRLEAAPVFPDKPNHRSSLQRNNYRTTRRQTRGEPSSCKVRSPLIADRLVDHFYPVVLDARAECSHWCRLKSHVRQMRMKNAFASKRWQSPPEHQRLVMILRDKMKLSQLLPFVRRGFRVVSALNAPTDGGR